MPFSQHIPHLSNACRVTLRSTSAFSPSSHASTTTKNNDQSCNLAQTLAARRGRFAGFVDVAIDFLLEFLACATMSAGSTAATTKTTTTTVTEIKSLDHFKQIRDGGGPDKIIIYAKAVSSMFLVLSCHSRPPVTRIFPPFKSWCRPCESIGPVFDKVAEQHSSKVDFYAFDVDGCRGTSPPKNSAFVPCAPTFSYFNTRVNNAVSWVVGARTQTSSRGGAIAFPSSSGERSRSLADQGLTV
ncbi:hypothetical protein V8E36_008718 [Tilletia maclaganii]